MQNPWKLSTLVLAGVLLISHARADSTSDWRQDVLGHLQSAARILEEHGESKTGKSPAPAPGDTPPKKTAETPPSKALQLTRAAIVQMKRTTAE